MAATVNIYSYHGSAGGTSASVDGGTIRFKLADNDTQDANNPIVIPSTGTAYSYIKQLRFYAATDPSNSISNLGFYTDGSASFGTGVGMQVKTSAGYTNPLTQADSQLTGTSDAFGYTSGEGTDLDVTGSHTSGAPTAFGDYVVLQMTVASTATQGTTSTDTFTFSYDES